MYESQNNSDRKKPVTPEESLALAAKLDEELNDFIAGLEKRKYTEGWPEDKWEEEMEKHPFFMTKFPKDDEVPPLLEGLQQLKYDENENTPLELAKSYKEDGNFNFKYKKYRMAILSYTEGIRKHCGDPEIEAQLYSNRAAAQFYLGNFRSSLSDSCQALKIKPNYLKAKIRAAHCCIKLKLYEEAIQYCDDILQCEPGEPTALKIFSEAVTIKKQQERDKRKQKIKEKKFKSSVMALKEAIESRKIQVSVDGDIFDSLELAQEKPVLENGELLWPVFFLYPEYSVSDFIEHFNENSKFFDHLMNMFTEPPDWDKTHEYQPDSLALYHEGQDRSKLYTVDVNKTLSEILSSGEFEVRDWKPSFLVLVKGSAAEANFIKNYTLAMFLRQRGSLKLLK